MLGLNNDQRRVLADKAPDLANLIVGALVVGQFVRDHAISWTPAIVGFGIWVVLMAFSLLVMKGRRS